MFRILHLVERTFQVDKNDDQVLTGRANCNETATFLPKKSLNLNHIITLSL
jgi:hypothetical protein